MIVDDSISMPILTGEKSCAAWGAQCENYERISKPRSFASQSIEVGRLKPRKPSLVSLFLLYAAECIPPLIIGVDKHKIWSFIGKHCAASVRNEANQEQKPPSRVPKIHGAKPLKKSLMRRFVRKSIQPFLFETMIAIIW